MVDPIDPVMALHSLNRALVARRREIAAEAFMREAFEKTQPDQERDATAGWESGRRLIEVQDMIDAVRRALQDEGAYL